MSQRIIIIGASSGIGRSVALDFARKGWSVGIAARRESLLKEIADEVPGKIVYKAIDVTDDDADVKFRELIVENGGMDYLLFASGIGYLDASLDGAKVVSTLRVNAEGFARIMVSAYKYFQEKSGSERGQICAITSVAGTKGIGLSAAYSASKRFEQTFIDALEQLAVTSKVNVGFTDIRPGFIRTDLLDANRKYPFEMTLDYAVKRIERAMLRRRRVAIIDGRWRVAVALWRCVPQWIWRHIALNKRI